MSRRLPEPDREPTPNYNVITGTGELVASYLTECGGAPTVVIAGAIGIRRRQVLDTLQRLERQEAVERDGTYAGNVVWAVADGVDSATITRHTPGLSDAVGDVSQATRAGAPRVGSFADTHAREQ